MSENSDVVLKKVGERFNLFRRLLGKSLEELAVDLKTSVQSLKDVENGKKEDILSFLNHLDEGYGVNFHWLITGEQSIFFCCGPKVERKIYELVTLLPWIAEMNETHNLQWLLAQMEDPHKKEKLYRLLDAFNKRVQGTIPQLIPPAPKVEC